MNFKFDFIRKLGSFNVLPITGTLREKCPIRSFSGPYFPPFGLNTDQKKSKYGLFTQCKKGAAFLITNWDRYYKVGKVLQSGSIITK